MDVTSIRKSKLRLWKQLLLTSASLGFNTDLLLIKSERILRSTWVGIVNSFVSATVSIRKSRNSGERIRPYEQSHRNG